MGFFSQIKEKFVGKSAKQNEKYVAGLDRSNSTFSDRINELAARFREINDEYFEELENILIMSDVGVSKKLKTRYVCKILLTQKRLMRSSLIKCSLFMQMIVS